MSTHSIRFYEAIRKTTGIPKISQILLNKSSELMRDILTGIIVL